MFWLLSSLLVHLFIILSNGVAAQNDISVTNVGAIVDFNSRIGREQKAAMEIAAESFNNKSNTRKLLIHFRDSEGKPFLAGSAAEELMKEVKVQVIVGMEYWPEAALVADLVRNQSQVVPVISFGAPLITPPLIQSRWPFLIRMTSDGSTQMKCIADIVAAYKWRRVVVIYEDDGYGGYVGLLGLLSEALQEANAKIEDRLVLPISSVPEPNFHELKELLKLPTFQSRVFIVLQSSLPTVNNLFEVAKKMGLVGRDSAWIFTECITSLLAPQGNTDMEGALGIKTYYSESTSYAEFQKEFQATKNARDCTSLQEMINALLSNYKGLSGNMSLKEGEAQLVSPRLRILNVVDGKMNTELNFWTPKVGFSEGLDTNITDVVGKVIWPRNLTRAPKGWAMPSVERPMKIGVPGKTSFSKFVKVESKENADENTYDGFCIQMFYKVLSRLNYPLPYEFQADNASYDKLVEKVQNKMYDAVVGDITVRARRMKQVEFTQPYMGSGLSMIVPEVTDEEARWMFMQPFHMANIGTAVLFTFSSLFFAHREKVFGNLTRVVFLIWLFVVLILTSSYTANLSSMLTVQRLQPNVTDMQMLVNSSSPVGVDGDSFLYTHMKDVIGFKPDNLINYCEGYTATTPTLRFGGLSFIFQKGSPIARDFTKAILELLENGEIKKLQNEWLTPEEECSKNSTHRPKSLSLNSFSGLYVICGVTSTFCLLLSLAMWMRRFQLQDTNEGSASSSDENIWNKTVRIVKFFILRDLEIPTRAPTFASYVVDLTTPRWGEYSPTSSNPEQPPAFTPAEIECMPVEQTETRKSFVNVSGTYRSSDDVGNVTWPGNITLRPSKGWAMPTVEKKMKNAIPTQNSPFITVQENGYDGFCIQLFNMVVGNLSHLYSLPHEFLEFKGNFSDLIELVNDKTYDAIVGDMTVLVERIDKVEFTQPYLESGLTMIVPDISDEEETWMFLKPFTWQMWVVTGAILIYTTFIVWFLEVPSSPDLKGSLKSQIAFSTWFTFSSLFFAHREKVYSNLTRIVFIVWLFVVLILSSSYTANLSSMLTIRRLSPNVTDIDMLRRTNSLVGCDEDSFVRNYLENVLGFNLSAVVVINRSYEPEEIRQKKLSAVFLELPYAQVFMDNHTGYTLTQPTYNFGGFSFVFQKGSPITRDFSKIILDLLENGEVRKLQNQWLTKNNRPTNTTSDMPESLSLKSFWGLFVISGATSTFCFLIALTIWLKKLCHQEASQGI
ncbi:hypothetical protein ACLB2K_025091 [Fragaria x ananassa]